jgi:hypothetical protein
MKKMYKTIVPFFVPSFESSDGTKADQTGESPDLIKGSYSFKVKTMHKIIFFLFKYFYCVSG